MNSRSLKGFLILTTLWVGCGGNPPHSAPPGNAIPTPAAMPTCQVPGTADSIVVFNDAYNGCHSPNMGLEHGKLCFSGEAWACDRMRYAITNTSLVKDPINVGANHGGSGRGTN